MIGAALFASKIEMIAGSAVWSQYSAIGSIPSGYCHYARRAIRSLGVLAVAVSDATNSIVVFSGQSEFDKEGQQAFSK